MQNSAMLIYVGDANTANQESASQRWRSERAEHVATGYAAWDMGTGPAVQTMKTGCFFKKLLTSSL